MNKTKNKEEKVKEKMKKVLGWHFCRNDMTLDNGDGRKIIDGETLTVDCEPMLCKQGLHASKSPLDALGYANGNVVCRVKIAGIIITRDDRMVATERTCLWHINAEELLYQFARMCGLDVLDVIDKLDAQKIAAARDAARGTVWEATWVVAREAASVARRVAAWEAARKAGNGRGSGEGSSGEWEEVRAKQERRLIRLIYNTKRKKYGN